MKNIGIHFHAPEDENFTLSILSLLELFNFQDYMWQIDTAEIHLTDEYGNFTNEMMFDDKRFITGHRLEETLQNNDYYLIFLTMGAFPDMKKSSPTWVTTAKDFINTDCEFLLSIVDGFDISILCKDKHLLQKLYQHVQDLGYLDTKYLTESNSGTFF
ncbi:DUF2691 family protein [Bacillus pseudomycoides]|uniref:DUF2691 family protein n=1 Tax=Bacillus pseudomycoides TaxID=64104 RepID=UPI000BEF7326|nr:DUF2691 family protein [Bacillus pseudomycoides]PEK68708.1 hypothetical protein CN593_11340 [Bacillus pseudomycoides]PEO48152.1 hypothetical protein CN559_12750 [Bacillus pseudomycoides]PFY52288.1 hypothetical protein COL49_29500 [Bacillus pseudomycoides]PGE25347.1 hypothetical protein COM57_21760 [Bacillus pseudomycoides]